MELHISETAMSARREQATDARGLPSSYALALKALAGTCAHCSQRAVVATGDGIGVCRMHRHQRAWGIAARERMRQAIDRERRDT